MGNSLWGDVAERIYSYRIDLFITNICYIRNRRFILCNRVKLTIHLSTASVACLSSGLPVISTGEGFVQCRNIVATL